MKMKLCVCLLFVGFFLAQEIKALPKWAPPGTCESGDECKESECCALGFVRYSLPKCRPHGNVDDWCFANSEAENRTLTYPNGESIQFRDTYSLFCPCREGLECRGNVCQPII